jgi:uncharacterized peroxidase-related enzyme
VSWIQNVAEAAARGRLKQLYAKARGAGPVDNILTVHGLRPHTLDGHLALYRSVLHHDGNTLPRWQLELIGVYVSVLNACEYCVEHHCRGLAGLLGAETAGRYRELVERDEVEAFPRPLSLMLRYAAVLTRLPSALAESHIAELRANGLDDGQILELNQVTAYFGYANRTVLGLGVRLETTPQQDSGG